MQLKSSLLKTITFLLLLLAPFIIPTGISNLNASIYLHKYFSLKKSISLISSSSITGSSVIILEIFLTLKLISISLSYFIASTKPSDVLFPIPKGTFTICPI